MAIINRANRDLYDQGAQGFVNATVDEQKRHRNELTLPATRDPSKFTYLPGALVQESRPCPPSQYKCGFPVFLPDKHMPVYQQQVTNLYVAAVMTKPIHPPFRAFAPNLSKLSRLAGAESSWHQAPIQCYYRPTGSRIE